MLQLIQGCIGAALGGLFFGLFFPTLLPTTVLVPTLFLFLGFAGVVILIFLIENKGFKNPWEKDKVAEYLYYPAVLVCVLFGILLGNGKVGDAVVMIFRL